MFLPARGRRGTCTRTCMPPHPSAGAFQREIPQMPSPPDLPERLLVAVGGNATHPPEIRGTAEEQAAIAATTGRALLPLLRLRERTHHHARKRPRRGQNPHATGDFERAGDADDARHLRRSQPGGNRLPAHAGVRERAQARGRPAPRGLPPDPGRGRPRGSGLRRADEVRGLHLHGRRSRAL